jgi:hypothetical protein
MTISQLSEKITPALPPGLEKVRAKAGDSFGSDEN